MFYAEFSNMQVAIHPEDSGRSFFRNVGKYHTVPGHIKTISNNHSQCPDNLKYHTNTHVTRSRKEFSPINTAVCARTFDFDDLRSFCVTSYLLVHETELQGTYSH
jgi:hypothetical protein